MTKRARLAVPAAEELAEAVARIDVNRPGWGDKLYAEVLDALDHIERHPRAWQVIDDGSERHFVLDRFPCVLVFLETDTEIIVTAVVYAGREPGYWRRR